MTVPSNVITDPRMTAAIAEITEFIRDSYPDTTFEVAVDEDEETVFVTAVVDVEDPDEVVDSYIDRMVNLQVEEGLHLHIIPVRNPARRDQLRHELGIGAPARRISNAAGG